jgi:NitT/TauT family transport system substrate-binding protein
MRTGRRLGVVAALGVLVAGAGAGCFRGSDGAGGAVTTLRLGYFPNLTHATAIVGLEKGILAEELGSTKLETRTFNAGPAAVEALFSGAIDATYIGPSPTVTAFTKSKGAAIRVISGATSGGAALVVRPDITSAQQLRGTKLATPQLGNTQDVALRYWLKQQGVHTTKEGGGDVSILPQDNSQTLDAFANKAVDGAWVPEPYATRLVQAGGKVLVDERSLWPGGQFVTTHLVVRTEFLTAHPDVVRALLRGQVRAVDYVNANTAEAQAMVGEAVGKLTGKPLAGKVVSAAWRSMSFTYDPLASTVTEGAKHAEEVGLLDDVDLNGLYDVTLLDEVLKAANKPTVTQP